MLRFTSKFGFQEGIYGPFQPSNFACAESSANEQNNRFFSFALDLAYVGFDVWNRPKLV